MTGQPSTVYVCHCMHVLGAEAAEDSKWGPLLPEVINPPLTLTLALTLALTLTRARARAGGALRRAAGRAAAPCQPV